MFNWALVLTAGFTMDLMLGDPRLLYHPVRVMGCLVSLLERAFGFVFTRGKYMQFTAGFVLFTVVSVTSYAVVYFVLKYSALLSPKLVIAINIIFCYQVLAARCLYDESILVYNNLIAGDLSAARKALSYIVGRDTAVLTEEQVVKATVETISENTADGVVAPMLFFALGGAPLAFLYKAVNTMDSMIAYRNNRYLYFGRTAAYADDLFNYFPALISAYIMVIASWILKMDYSSAFRIYKRDKKNHPSPNSARTEAVCAGALGLMLGGSGFYGGKLVEKMTIGDNTRKALPQDIKKAGKLMFVTSFLCLIFCLILSGAFQWIYLKFY